MRIAPGIASRLMDLADVIVLAVPACDQLGGERTWSLRPLGAPGGKWAISDCRQAVLSSATPSPPKGQAWARRRAHFRAQLRPRLAQNVSTTLESDRGSGSGQGPWARCFHGNRWGKRGWSGCRCGALLQLERDASYPIDIRISVLYTRVSDRSLTAATTYRLPAHDLVNA